MSCSKFKVPTTTSSKYTDGVAFTFHFSRAANLSLVAVDIKDGIPKLQFVPAQNVPALSEEDVAVIVKLCQEGKRPCFFYEGFHPFHPFYGSGRLFKGHRPRDLRGTSIGETLAEADWAMKCLHVGVRSDKEKKHFWSWNKTSNLTGLRTREDFDENLPGASVIMKCNSVDVVEEADELCFVGQPKMRIDCVRDGRNSDYSKYVTGIFDNVAYHDEPLFLKVQEIIKLVLAIEWLSKKLKELDMSFSRKWVNEHMNKPRQQTNELVEVIVPPDEAERIMNEATAAETEEKNLELVSTEGFDVRVLNKKISKNGFQVQASATAGAATEEIEVRGTFNDYDFLYEGLDPNQPTGMDGSTMEPLLPNVQSWNELRRETVPCPCIALYSPADGRIGPPVTGGVSTQSFSTNHVKRSSEGRTKPRVIVPAGEQVSMKYKDIPKPGPTVAPPTDVTTNTTLSEMGNELRGAGIQTGAGQCNSDLSSASLFSENGELLAEKKELDTRFTLPGVFDCSHVLTELLPGGREGETIREHMHLLPEHVKGKNQQAAACARDSNYA